MNVQPTRLRMLLLKSLEMIFYCDVIPTSKKAQRKADVWWPPSPLVPTHNGRMLVTRSAPPAARPVRCALDCAAPLPDNLV